MDQGMIIRNAILLSGMLAAGVGELDAQDMRYAKSDIRMRAEATVESRVVSALPRGARVEVRACAVAWCWIGYGGRTGYVPEPYLAAVPQIRNAGARTYTNAKGANVPAPLLSRGGPPVGATARCRDGTYSFSQSRSGTCAGHRGVARWF